MNYAEMEAGPEMDCLVAEKVMGWRPYTSKGVFLDELGGVHNTHPSAHGVGSWHPSELIAHAWEVIEHLAANKRKWLDLIQTDDGWMVGQGGRGYADSGGRVDLELIGAAEANTAPLAICRAALMALKPEGEE